MEQTTDKNQNENFIFLLLKTLPNITATNPCEIAEGI